jgi:hypothetical protein
MACVARNQKNIVNINLAKVEGVSGESLRYLAENYEARR